MVLIKSTVALMALQAISLVYQPSRALEDFLSPLLSPVLNGMCKAVYCGKGSCKVLEKGAFGFSCQCDAGWTQFHIENHFRFLPCIIPNCSLNYSCSNIPTPHRPAPTPAPPRYFSHFDPCEWSYCGGGECIRNSIFEHKCNCWHGYKNLLNVSSFPCFQDCSIGADCSNLGIVLSNTSSTPSSSPTFSFSDSINSCARGCHALKNLLWLTMVMTSVSMI